MRLVSNLQTAPELVTCDAGQDCAGVELLPARDVPLGGPRAMQVRRSLPQRARSLIGAWCFVDHYGPDDVAASGGMVVPGHPHTGLQTVSWLSAGEVEHRDTTGVHAFVRPGELNIMTAGSGIAHSEHSTASTSVLHGVQLWVALPEAHRNTAPGFTHYAPDVVGLRVARARVFLGSLFGQRSPVATWSELIGAEVVLDAGASLEIEVDPAHEHGLLADTGTISMGELRASAGEILFHPIGTDTLRVRAGDDGPARFLVLGGEPFGEQIVMWWNFIGRSHSEITAFRDDWQRERGLPGGDPQGRFGSFPDAWATTLPAPELPNLRLRSRG